MKKSRCNIVDYIKLVEIIPAQTRQTVADKLVDFVLTSKNEERMPPQLANNIIHYWQKDLLSSEAGLAALLEAATLLEPEKTVGALNELQLANVAGQIKP
jgi:hypothetical protein